MAEYLVFRLYGPLASWGEIAVGESRHSASHPSRSALLGLFGAALGVRRDDEARQQQLFTSFYFGVKLTAMGTPQRDYHTVQVPPQRSKVVYGTRRQETANKLQLSALLSSREYRCDSVAIVAAQANANPSWTLQQVSDALKRPRFTLYLGRKSCVPALPLAPLVVNAPTLRKALDAPQVSLSSLVQRRNRSKFAPQRVLLEQNPDMQWPAPEDRYLFRLGAAQYFWEENMEFGAEKDMEQVRHDQPVSRRRWQFAPHREWVYLDRTDEEKR